MATYWYFRAMDEEFGPVPFAELVEMVRDGVLGDDDLVRSDWEREWQRARSVPGLFYMASREPVAQSDDAQADDAQAVGTDANSSGDEGDAEEHAVAENAGVETDSGDAKEPWRPPWLQRLIGLQDSWLKSPSAAGSGAADGAAGAEGGAAGDGRFSSLVDQAINRLDEKNAPPTGRLSRLFRRGRRAVSTVASPSFLRRAFRLGAALVGANLAALGVDRWTAHQALRFPSRQATTDMQFPGFGTCRLEEYVLLMTALMVIAGILAYAVAALLESAAEDN